MLHVVLVEPEIPPNTGNVSRLCVGLNATLHLVEPLGFELSDRTVKRAGLDYWGDLRLERHASFEALRSAHPAGRYLFASAKAEKLHTDWAYAPGDFLVFGKETRGLPEALLDAHPDAQLRIPHWGPVRSLNLSNAVAVVAYEAMRQFQVAGLAPPVPRLPDRV